MVRYVAVRYVAARLLQEAFTISCNMLLHYCTKQCLSKDYGRFPAVKSMEYNEIFLPNCYSSPDVSTASF